MARIVLADYDRIIQGGPQGWLTEHERRMLHEDLLCLLGFGPSNMRTVGDRAHMLGTMATTLSRDCNQSVLFDAPLVFGLTLSAYSG